MLLLPAGVVGATDLALGLLPARGHILATRGAPGTEP